MKQGGHVYTERMVRNRSWRLQADARVHERLWRPAAQGDQRAARLAAAEARDHRPAAAHRAQAGGLRTASSAWKQAGAAGLWSNLCTCIVLRRSTLTEIHNMQQQHSICLLRGRRKSALLRQTTEVGYRKLSQWPRVGQTKRPTASLCSSGLDRPRCCCSLFIGMAMPSLPDCC
jgi:hypothetical protein